MDGGGDLVESRRGLFQGRGLALGALRQIVGALGDLGAAGADGKIKSSRLWAIAISFSW